MHITTIVLGVITALLVCAWIVHSVAEKEFDENSPEDARGVHWHVYQQWLKDEGE